MNTKTADYRFDQKIHIEFKGSETFDKCVKRSEENGLHSIDCVLGLWGVSGPDSVQVEQQAALYFFRYLQAGEYDNHLKVTTHVEH